MFKTYSYNERHSVPLANVPVKDKEAFVIGKVMTISGGALTTAAVNSDGAQKYITISNGTGDGVTPVPCVRIQRQHNFIVEAAKVTGTPTIGQAYTLNATLDGITNTSTKGVFVVDHILDNGDVVGNFRTTSDR